MRLFEQKTEILKFDSLSNCIIELDFDEKDIILTSHGMYRRSLEGLIVKVPVLYHDDYGKGEPTDIKINNIINDSKKYEFNRVVAIGGGTVMDIAKFLVLEGLDDCNNAFERKIDFVKSKQLICIPTTCGTGSEVTSFTVAEITSKKTKMGLGDPALIPDIAVIIPEVLKDLPYNSFMHSAIDALIHAMESYLSPKATAFTELYSLKAIEMILDVFNLMAEKGVEYNLDYLEEMLTASTFAGIAFGNAGVGAVHALSYPLSGKYHVPHGEANYQFFTEVFKIYESKNPTGKIKKLCTHIHKVLVTHNDDIFDDLENLLDKLIDKPALRDYGMMEDEVAGFSRMVLDTQQRLLNNNYIELNYEDIYSIYGKLY